MKAVPVGYNENWKYVGRWRERKIKPSIWKFSFEATKRRKSKSMGNMGIGTKGAWKINAIQYIQKTDRGEYQTRMIGTKRALKFHVKHRSNK